MSVESQTFHEIACWSKWNKESSPKNLISVLLNPVPTSLLPAANSLTIKALRYLQLKNCPEEPCLLPVFALISRYSCSKKNSFSPNAGFSSSSQVALGSNFAKKSRSVQAGFRAWKNFSAKRRSPAISSMPTMPTLPGEADMDGPRAVRAVPATRATAELKIE